MTTLPLFTYADLIPIVANIGWEATQNYYPSETLEGAVYKQLQDSEELLKVGFLSGNKELANIGWRRISPRGQTQFLYRLLTQEPTSEISLESVTQPEHSLALIKAGHLDLLKEEIETTFKEEFIHHETILYRTRFKKRLEAFLDSSETRPSIKGITDYYEKKFLTEIGTRDPYRLQKLALDIAIQEEALKKGRRFPVTEFLVNPSVNHNIRQRFIEISDKLKRKYENYLNETPNEINNSETDPPQEKISEGNPSTHKNSWVEIRDFSSTNRWGEGLQSSSHRDNQSLLKKLQFLKDIETSKAISDKERAEIVKDRINQFRSSKEERISPSELFEFIIPFLPLEEQNIAEIISLLPQTKNNTGEGIQYNTLKRSKLNNILLQMTLGPEADIRQNISLLLSNTRGWKIPKPEKPLDLESVLLNRDTPLEQWKLLLENAPLLSTHLDVLVHTLWLDRTEPLSQEKISILLNHGEQASQAMVKSMLHSSKEGQGIREAIDWLSTHAPLSSEIALNQLLTSLSSGLFERTQRARELRGIRTIASRHPQILFTHQHSGHTPLSQAIDNSNNTGVKALLSRSGQRQISIKTGAGETVWEIMLNKKKFLSGILRFSHTIESSAINTDEKWAHGMHDTAKKIWQNILSKTHPHLTNEEAVVHKPRSPTQKKWDELLISLWRQDRPIGALEAEASRRGISREKQGKIRRTPSSLSSKSGSNPHFPTMSIRSFVAQRLPSLNDRLWDEHNKKDFDQVSVHDWLEQNNPRCLKKPGHIHSELNAMRAKTKQLEQKINLERLGYMQHKDNINSNWKKVKP